MGESIAEVAAKDRYPHLYRVGAYAFFAWLAFWSAMPMYAIGRWLGLADTVRGVAGNTVMIVTFLALRDMTTRPLKRHFPSDLKETAHAR